MKKIISFVLVFVMCLSLTAYGSASNKEDEAERNREIEWAVQKTLTAVILRTGVKLEEELFKNVCINADNSVDIDDYMIAKKMTDCI